MVNLPKRIDFTLKIYHILTISSTHKEAPGHEPGGRLHKKPRRVCRFSGKEIRIHFLSGRVPDRKFFSGCKCASCAPMAHNECAQQTVNFCRKAPQGIFDSLAPGHEPGGTL